MLVTFELIEAGAGRREQDRVTGGCAIVRVGDGRVQRAAFDQRGRAVQGGRNFNGGRTDQENALRFGRERLAEGGVIETLVFASQDDPQIAWERVESLEGGVDAGCFRIVI